MLVIAVMLYINTFKQKTIIFARTFISAVASSYDYTDQ